MNKQGIFIVCMVLFFVLLPTACDTEPRDNESFENRLQGTWETNELYSLYDGTLEITKDSITIEGYYERPGDRNDLRRPFREFTKNFPLKGYSEKIDDFHGTIYIEEFGVLHEVPYKYDSNNTSNNRMELLSFTFPSADAEINRIETLKKVIE